MLSMKPSEAEHIFQLEGTIHAAEFDLKDSHLSIVGLLFLLIVKYREDVCEFLHPQALLALNG